MILIAWIMIDWESEDVMILIFTPQGWTMKKNEVVQVTSAMMVEEEAAVNPWKIDHICIEMNQDRIIGMGRNLIIGTDQDPIIETAQDSIILVEMDQD